jgi:rubrerythrin
MKPNKRQVVLGLITVASLLVALIPASAWLQAQESGKTTANLLASLKNELTARSRYLAFADVAESEGYKQVASLFRAQARAEEVHAEKYQEVLKKLGVEPPRDYETITAQKTPENLAAAVDVERMERDSIYPTFIDQAMKEGQREAVEAFELARSTEVEHFNLCNDAIHHLDEMKTARDYYVCGVCGYTAPYLVFQKCVACGAPRSKFEAVR